jgi:colanic acid/amylovoran biosynthesis glycosyltransferase
MRIAFLVGRFPSLSETFILNQITGLIDRGHEVDIYARKPDDGQKVHPDVEKYNLRDRVIYRQMPTNGAIRLIRGMALAAGGSGRNPGVIARSLNIARFGREASSLKLLYWAAAFLKQQKTYDIVHGHFGPNGLLALSLRQIGAIHPTAKIVATFYGYDVHRYPRNHGQDVYHPLFAEAARILTLSQVMRQDVMHLGCPDNKAIVHHIGTDPGRFRLSVRQPSTDRVIRLVSIARLVEKKGLEFAIRAIAKVVAAGQTVSYDIVGDGDLHGRLDSLIAELNLTGIVRLLGWQTQQQVVEILDRSHVLLAPSVTAASGDQEGTPVALMEAMAMGLPVVSTHHSGISEVVRDGVCGYLVPERDVDALADRILALGSHPEHWEQMGRAGRAIVEAEFDTSRLADELLRIYAEVL